MWQQKLFLFNPVLLYMLQKNILLQQKRLQDKSYLSSRECFLASKFARYESQRLFSSGGNECMAEVVCQKGQLSMSCS